VRDDSNDGCEGDYTTFGPGLTSASFMICWVAQLTTVIAYEYLFSKIQTISSILMLEISFSINLKLFRPIIFVFAYDKTLLVRFFSY